VARCARETSIKVIPYFLPSAVFSNPSPRE
jgi:hypothetical protein